MSHGDANPARGVLETLENLKGTRMTILQRAAKFSERVETERKAADFCELAARIALAGDVSSACEHAKSGTPASFDVMSCLKAAVAAGGIGVGTWDEIAQYPALVAAYLRSFESISAFDRILPSMKNVPLRTRAVVATGGATGYVVDEGSPTPLSALSLVDVTVPAVKALAVIVVSRELLQLGAPGSLSLFSNELRNALSIITDERFIANITESVVPLSSSGGSATNVIRDLDAALQAIRVDASSSLFVVTTPSVARGWSTRMTSIGTFAFPGMSPQGGSIVGIPTIVSLGAPADSFVLLDANALAGSSGTIEINSASQTSLQFETAPDDPIDATTIMESLWQTNRVALRALRLFGAKRLRDSSVAIVEDCLYTDNSPPTS